MATNSRATELRTFQSAAALTSNVTAAPGLAVQITASGAGTVTLTLADGSTIVVTVPTNDTVYPYAVTKFVAGTATVTAVYNLT